MLISEIVHARILFTSKTTLITVGYKFQAAAEFCFFSLLMDWWSLEYQKIIVLIIFPAKMTEVCLSLIDIIVTSQFIIIMVDSNRT